MALLLAGMAGAGLILGLKSQPANLSQQIVETVSETTNNFFSKYATETKNEITTSGIGYQYLGVNLQNSRGCPVSITQDMKISIANTVNLLNMNKAEISNDLLSQIKRDISQSLEQSAQGLFAPQNVANAVTKIHNYLDNNVSTIVENSIKNIVKTDASGTQIQEINMSGADCGGKLSNFSQNMVLIAVADQVSKNINDGIIQNKQISEDTATIDQKAIQESIGLGTGCLIFIIICCLLCCISSAALMYWQIGRNK